MSLKILDGVKLDFDDVAILPKRSVMASRSSIQLERDFQFYWSNQVWNGVPIAIANMDTIGTFETASVAAKYKLITCLHKFYSIEELLKFYSINTAIWKYVWYSLGIREEDFEKLKLFLNKTQEIRDIYDLKLNINCDIANGYTERFISKISELRDLLPNSIICAGNVVTPNMVEEIILHGRADIVKCGIACGGKCRTKNMTGVFYPQLSCIAECADAAHGLKNGNKKLALIMGDGGIKQPCDFCKGFGGGADFLMSGSFFMGSDTTQAESKTENGIKYYKCYGMSSQEAQEKYYGEMQSYKTSEGSCEWVADKGSLENLIQQVFGSVRSYCAYINSPNLKDAHKCTTFIRI